MANRSLADGRVRYIVSITSPVKPSLVHVAFHLRASVENEFVREVRSGIPQLQKTYTKKARERLVFDGF